QGSGTVVVGDSVVTFNHIANAGRGGKINLWDWASHTVNRAVVTVSQGLKMRVKLLFLEPFVCAENCAYGGLSVVDGNFLLNQGKLFCCSTHNNTVIEIKSHVVGLIGFSPAGVGANAQFIVEAYPEE
ncbi:hypothetical protein PFISCL1PPCAC_17642, partial [Pristionchus fissidentatus]